MSVAAYRVKPNRESSMGNTVHKIEEFTEIDLEQTLGIDPTIFRDAMQSGISLFKSATEFHPVTTGGSRAWEEVVGIIRFRVVDKYDGWRAAQQNGMPVLINSSKAITIVITSGDENTGIVSADEPRTKNAKGQVTESFVGKNLDLFSIEKDSNLVELSSIDSHQTWVLLYTIDKEKSEVRFELSLPTSTALSGNQGRIKICEWQKRVLFPAIAFSEAIINVTDSSQDFTDDSDFFNVEKK